MHKHKKGIEHLFLSRTPINILVRKRLLTDLQSDGDIAMSDEYFII